MLRVRLCIFRLLSVLRIHVCLRMVPAMQEKRMRMYLILTLQGHLPFSKNLPMTYLLILLLDAVI